MKKSLTNRVAKAFVESASFTGAILATILVLGAFAYFAFNTVEKILNFYRVWTPDVQTSTVILFVLIGFIFTTTFFLSMTE